MTGFPENETKPAFSKWSTCAQKDLLNPPSSDRVESEFAVEVAPALDLLQGKIGFGNSAGSGAYLIIMKRGKGFFYRGWRRSLRPLSRSNRERILQKWNEFAITTTRKSPLSLTGLMHSTTFLCYGGNSQHFFWRSFILMKRWPRALQEMKAKAPRARVYRGGHQIKVFSLRGEKSSKEAPEASNSSGVGEWNKKKFSTGMHQQNCPSI